MGMQVSCSVHTEMPPQESVRIAGEGYLMLSHELAHQKECRIEERHIRLDHVYMLISISLKHKVSAVVCFIEDKSAIWIARHCDGRYWNFNGQVFLGVGCNVRTVGHDEKLIRKYIRKQEDQDWRDDGQMNLPFE